MMATKPEIIQIFGTSRLEGDKLKPAIFAAGDAGYQIIDTAFTYGNEKEVGEAVAAYNKSHKNQLLIQTKITPKDYGDVASALKRQMKALNVKKAFSVLLHWPDWNAHVTVDAWKQLVALQKKGLVERIGVSNFDKDLIQICAGTTGVKPWANQIELSVLSFRLDRVTFCNSVGIQVQGWQVLGKEGVITSDKTVLAIAKAHKVSPQAIAIAYMNNMGVVPVVRSSNPDHIAHNLAASKLKLTKGELEKLGKLNLWISRRNEGILHEHSAVLSPETLKRYKY